MPNHAGAKNRWRWTAMILGAVVLGIGCNPATLLTFLVYPWVDHNLPPVYELKTANKEATVVLNTFFARVEVRPELLSADRDLNARLAHHLHKRFEANKKKIKIITDAQVRQFLNQPANPLFAAEELGKHFQADYVISLEINSLSFYEENSYHQFYRGNADLRIAVHKVGAETGTPAFEMNYRRSYPENGPVHATDATPGQFRTQFFDFLGRDISRFFAAYPPEERMEIR